MSSTPGQQQYAHPQQEGKHNYTLVGLWLRRLGETYLGAWLIDFFQQSTQAMASATAAATTSGHHHHHHHHPGSAATGGGGGHGPLSFMGCMREASPPPFDELPPQSRPAGLPTGEFLSHGFDSIPKEPKKRRFHPLRGLRRIFRKKSRGAADARLGGVSGPGSGSDRETSGGEGSQVATLLRDREEVTLRDPAGRAEEIRSRSASELLTDANERDRLFLRRRGMEESFANLQRGGVAVGQLSVSHDSVFPGEVPHTRPLSSLDMHASLERRTPKASDAEHKDSNTAQRHRISLRVLEQIKTVIENRNQIAVAGPTAATTTTAAAATETANSLHSRFGSRDRSERAAEDAQAKVPRKDAPTPTNITTEAPSSPLKEDLPEVTTGKLTHTAARHRISVRPKNRRPPRRSTTFQPSTPTNVLTSSNGSINGQQQQQPSLRIDSISENSIDTLDSLEAMNLPSTADTSTTDSEKLAALDSPPAPATPTQEASKPIPILRKSSSRLSRNSEVFEELEAKLPVIRKPAVSPDSLESNLDSRSSADVLDISEDGNVKPIPKPSPRTASVGSDGYEKSAVSSPRRRTSSNRLSKSPDSLESTSPGWFTKSTEGFDKLTDFERESNGNGVQKPVAAARRLLLNPISKSQERVCTKSSDSLEALEALNSDDSMERRRSSFEIRPRRNQVHKIMSKSTECFDSTLVEHQEHVVKEEKRKRTSVSEINLSRGSSGSSGSRHNKLLSKSSESFEKIASLVEAHREKNEETEKNSNVPWRQNRRVAHSSESSDNLDLDDNSKLENRKVRKTTPKRLSSGSGGNYMDDHENVILRKPSSRLQKSSESSELGSTDTLDSERRNTMKSSDSDETLDSLEKDLQEQQSPPEQDCKDEETTESILERREKGTEEEDNEKGVGSYWRRRTNSQESKDTNNLDIHQLLAYSLVTRIQENGNNDADNEENHHHEEDRSSKICSASPVVVYPKKKQHQQQIQQQSSSEDNKTLSSTINNILSSKTDEDLQNMLNGNISEVSTDTKSFKEKLIMFEKLGK